MAVRQLDVVMQKGAPLELGDAEACVLHHWEASAGDDCLHSLVVRVQDVEGVMERLQDRDEVEVVLTRAIEACLPDPDDTDEGEGEAAETPLFARVSREELRERMDQAAAVDGPFMVLIVASTIVAALGLALDNTAVVIGAMVIAPLVGPNLLLALSTALVDVQLGLRALRVNGVGVATAFLLSLAVGALLGIQDSSEIALRTHVSLADIGLAIAAGTAGALSVTRTVDSALIGVMVAAAMLPPVVVSGMLVGAGDVEGAGNAGLLFAINLVSINLAAVATFALLGLKPRQWHDRQSAVWVVPAAIAIWTAMLLVFVGLMGWLRGWSAMVWPGP